MAEVGEPQQTCGICLEVVCEKTSPMQRQFGILSKCNHVFCLDCIRKWRSSKHLEYRIIRTCPMCRVVSNFVMPSQHWVEDTNGKIKVIAEYKKTLTSKPCQYVQEGNAKCPFNEVCIYLHHLHGFTEGRLQDSPTPMCQDRIAALNLIDFLFRQDFMVTGNTRNLVRWTQQPLNDEFVSDFLIFNTRIPNV